MFWHSGTIIVYVYTKRNEWWMYVPNRVAARLLQSNSISRGLQGFGQGNNWTQQSAKQQKLITAVVIRRNIGQSRPPPGLCYLEYVHSKRLPCNDCRVVVFVPPEVPSCVVDVMNCTLYI